MIELRAVRKSYGPRTIVRDLSLTIARGALHVLVGPSGCGKSTLLRMMNGLVTPDAGVVLVRGVDLSSCDQRVLRMGLGYVIQSIGLFPHWTAARNIAAVMELAGWPRPRIAKRVAELAAAFSLDDDLLQRYPHQMSGGQQQRVGVARALGVDPDIVLMDEPFGALDPVIRTTLQDEVLRLHRTSDKTIVFVTHDMDEALRLGTRITILDAGGVAQDDAPGAILRAPATPFVRAFVGGADRGLRMLSLTTLGDIARPGACAGPTLEAAASLREALSLMIAEGATRIGVTRAGCVIGVAELADVLALHAQ